MGNDKTQKKKFKRGDKRLSTTGKIVFVLCSMFFSLVPALVPESVINYPLIVELLIVFNILFSWSYGVFAIAMLADNGVLYEIGEVILNAPPLELCLHSSVGLFTVWKYVPDIMFEEVD